MENKKILGVIGGLGPLATAYFMELVIQMTDARVDQEHLPMIVYNMPMIPDRTAYILDNSKENPFPMMLEIGEELSRREVACIAIPCITAHYFMGGLQAGLNVPVINGVEETVAHLKANGIRKVGILATSGTIQSGIFHQELRRQGLEPIAPDEQAQKDVMHLIFNNVKAGKPVEMERFSAVEKNLRSKGAEAMILGCTELSLIKREKNIGPGFIDAMEVLAREALRTCGKPVKKEYDCLITK
ncbi:MAG: aspartate/glutamate racemase family protein [Ruminococcaceae bacterium]|nr:aspartate/glutamate racemase family protein [Oscillospiraceae bacterium]